MSGISLVQTGQVLEENGTYHRNRATEYLKPKDEKYILTIEIVVNLEVACYKKKKLDKTLNTW